MEDDRTNERTTSELRLPKKVYRLLVAATVALWIQTLVNLPAALFSAGQILSALFGGPGPLTPGG
jgi:hypothetical protein